MKTSESRARHSGDGDLLTLDDSCSLGSSEHVSFSAGVTRSERRGEAFKRLRQINLAKAASARMSRPHKTG